MLSAERHSLKMKRYVEVSIFNPYFVFFLSTIFYWLSPIGILQGLYVSKLRSNKHKYKEKLNNEKLYGVLMDIEFLSSIFNFIMFSFNPRTQNITADLLDKASLANGSSYTLYWNYFELIKFVVQKQSFSLRRPS